MADLRLAFGIPSLDELLGRPTRPIEKDTPGHDFGIDLTGGDHATSLCLIGPDGTGKSVLALHLAANYAATCGPEARIIYASTDLSYDMAKAVWANFALGRPGRRLKAIDGKLSRGRAWPKVPDDREESTPIRLTPLDMARYLATPPPNEGPREVAFLDLESATAGDDWGLINRLLATLDRPGEGQPRALLVIDAVEGLETLGGRHDSFGEPRDRRSRIAQAIRAAKGKCHVAFVVEERSEREERLPEEFVSDAVIRLRVERQRDYLRRTVEIEKLRGQSYVRGRHDCLIRPGKGSKTGGQENPDDPVVAIDGKPIAYFHVVPSLHYLSRAVMEARQEREARKRDAGGPPVIPDDRLEETPDETRQARWGLCRFGIKYLDTMIGDQGRAGAKLRGDFDAKPPLDGDPLGLPWGSVTALIGEEGTYKGRLAQSFLAHAFLDRSEVRPEATPRPSGPPPEPVVFRPEKGAAILLTTRDLDVDRLVGRFLAHQRAAMTEDEAERRGEFDRAAAEKRAEKMKSRTVCRRLEVHHLSPAVLFHIVHESVQQGMRILRADGGTPRHDPVKNPGRIRLVIDDWSAVQDAYPEVRDDPLFLPFLTFYLRRRGITSLILDSRPGRPDHVVEGDDARSIRVLSDHRLTTWKAGFFGERRVAIAAVPPISHDRPVVVREVRPAGRHGLIVDPRLEYYSGIAEGRQPALVPLEIHLFADSAAAPAYLDDVSDLFRRLRGDEGRDVIRPEAGSYEMLRDFAFLHGDTALERTVVLQVDEFWTQQNEGSLLDLRDYLDAQISDGKTTDLIEDPYQFFQVAEGGSERQPIRRHDLFNTVGYELLPEPDSASTGEIKLPRAVDRVPYTLDFGFLLADRRAWSACSDRPIRPGRTVGQVWGALAARPGAKEPAAPPQVVPWGDFFRACSIVAGAGGDRIPFDIDYSTAESLSCLVLELWASEIHELQKKPVFPAQRHLPRRNVPSLDSLIGPGDRRRALYRAWVLLEAMIGPELFKPLDPFRFRSRAASPRAVATRQWYSTACPTASAKKAPEMIPLRLPGHYACRGDWFLSVIRGSRSPRAGHRAIDVLTSKRANIMRMQLGMGLPTRGFGGDSVVSLRPPLGSAPTAPEGGDFGYAEFRSPLRAPGPDGRLRNLQLPDFWRLGAAPIDINYYPETAQAEAEFRWLWRSLIPDYDKHAKIWNKWLILVMAELRDLRTRGPYPSTAEALALYDGLGDWVRTGLAFPGDPLSLARFDELCEALRPALYRATISRAKA